MRTYIHIFFDILFALRLIVRVCIRYSNYDLHLYAMFKISNSSKRSQAISSSALRSSRTSLSYHKFLSFLLLKRALVQVILFDLCFFLRTTRASNFVKVVRFSYTIRTSRFVFVRTLVSYSSCKLSQIVFFFRTTRANRIVFDCAFSSYNSCK